MIGIIGGGIQSLVAAWSLVRCGARVTIYERGRLGNEASGAAAAMLTALGEGDVWHRKLAPLLQEAQRQWTQFASLLHQETQFHIDERADGLLMVALHRDDVAAWQHRYGDGVTRDHARWLTADEVATKEPFMARTHGGWLCEGEKSVDSVAVMTALRRAVEKGGGTIHEGAQVQEIISSKGSVTGLRVDGEIHPMSRIVLAAGAWSSVIKGLPPQWSSWIRPVRGQIVTLRAREDSVLQGKPLVSHMVAWRQDYAVPRGDGRLLLGASSDEVGFANYGAVGALFDLLHHGRQLLPLLDEMEFVTMKTSLRPASHDGLPLVGAAPDHWRMAGLFVATGHYRNGILLAPLTAQAVQKWYRQEPHPYEAMSLARLASMSQEKVA